MNFIGRKEELNTLEKEFRRDGSFVVIYGRRRIGKTTLIKLLLRLYEPDAGKMKYNGRSAQEIAVDDYRNCFSAMFQDFSIYEAFILK